MRTGAWPSTIARSVAHRLAWATRTSASRSAAGTGTSRTATRPGAVRSAARIVSSFRPGPGAFSEGGRICSTIPVYP